MKERDEKRPAGEWSGEGVVPLQEMARRLGERLDETARAAARRLPLRFPRSYSALIDPEDPSYPLRRIAWPTAE